MKSSWVQYVVRLFFLFFCFFLAEVGPNQIYEVTNFRAFFLKYTRHGESSPLLNVLDTLGLSRSRHYENILCSDSIFRNVRVSVNVRIVNWQKIRAVIIIFFMIFVLRMEWDFFFRIVSTGQVIFHWESFNSLLM